MVENALYGSYLLPFIVMTNQTQSHHKPVYKNKQNSNLKHFLTV